MSKLHLKPTTIAVKSMEELVGMEMNRRLPGYGWKVTGSFATTWDLVAEAKNEQPTELELNMVRVVANEVFKDLGLSPNTDVAWGMPARSV